MTTRLDPTDVVAEPGDLDPGSRKMGMWRLLLRDRVATAALVVLVLVVLATVLGSLAIGGRSNDQDLALGPIAPFSLDHGWLYVLGSDSLGRSMVARMVIGGRTTLLVAVPAVLISLVIGSLIGMWAGYHRGWRETVAMRVADVIMSFPSLLMAVVVLYVFSPSASMIVLVLAVTRIPIYLRTARAESAELQSRTFVDAARTFGTRPTSIIRRHVFPIVLPTLLTVATLDFCYVMLAESSLSFLGIGIQPPGVSWGLMVSQGREYLQTSWWLSFFPGLAIVVTAVASTVLASWVRIATDPAQRWRLTLPRQSGRRRVRRAPITEGEVL